MGNSIVGHFRGVEQRKQLAKQLSSIEVNLENKAVDLSFDDPRAEFERRTADGTIEQLSDEQYSALANAANSLDKLGALANYDPSNEDFIRRYNAGSELPANSFNSRVDAYNNTVGLLNNVYSQSHDARQQNAVSNAYRQRRYAIGNAQAAADFNTIAVSGYDVDLDDPEILARVAFNQTDAFSETVKVGIEAFSYFLPGGAIARLGGSLIKAGAIHTTKSAFRGVFISGASKFTATTGVAAGVSTIGGGAVLVSTGLDIASRGITREPLSMNNLFDLQNKFLTVILAIH